MASPFLCVIGVNDIKLNSQNLNWVFCFPMCGLTMLWLLCFNSIPLSLFYSVVFVCLHTVPVQTQRSYNNPVDIFIVLTEETYEILPVLQDAGHVRGVPSCWQKTFLTGCSLSRETELNAVPFSFSMVGWPWSLYRELKCMSFLFELARLYENLSNSLKYFHQSASEETSICRLCVWGKITFTIAVSDIGP